MSIHKVTNIFVGNGSALEASNTTLTPGKLGAFYADNSVAVNSAYVGGSATAKLQFSETFADGSFKKSMLIDGANVISAKATRYKPATREVWAIGYDRKLATGEIEVNNATDYTASIRFKNDKSLYSERPEVLRVNFTSAATATQLSIATQIAAAINNGGFKSLIEAKVVSNGPLVAASGSVPKIYGDGTLGAATKYGVEITALDINQFQSSTYKENRVYFSVHVDDSTGFGSTTTCTQIVANSYGEGTYNQVYNKENFEYQYEGLSNRRLWPAQAVKFNTSSTPVTSLTIAGTGNVGVTINDDIVTFATTNASLRAGELITLDAVNYEVKYLIGTTKAVLTAYHAGATNATAVLKARYFYSVIALTFADNTFTSGADVQALAPKSIYIATPAIDAGTAITTIGAGSTEGAALLAVLSPWLAATPNAFSVSTFSAV